MNRNHRSCCLLYVTLNLTVCATAMLLWTAAPVGADPEQISQPSFHQALPGYDYVFPRDHGSHDRFLTEWWYFTGHLFSTHGERYGYEVTFFRRAIDDVRVWRNQSQWALRQLYFAHFALTDSDSHRFRFAEKISRAGLGKAGAKQGMLDVWIDQWSVTATTADHQEFHVKASTPEFSVDLVVTLQKPPVIHGVKGVSQKGNNAWSTSHYYSLTRLATKGELWVDGEKKEVSGTSWMDHEFSSADLAEGLVGWDWFSIQLESGYEIMVYWLRREDGTFDPSSSGTLVTPNGSAQHLTRDNLRLNILEYWESQASGARYPSRWSLNIVPYHIHLTLTPHMADQELRTTKSTQITYWEGAVDVEGKAGKARVKGLGYVELTGYAEPYRPAS